MSGRDTTCVILPTRNEQANIAEVLRRIDALDVCDEVVIVDDSDDDTAEVAKAAADDLRLEVLVRHRRGAERHGGLGSAIVDGMHRTEAERIVVMDADLQHPPERIPDLLASLASTDLAIASRFNWDNVVAGLTPLRRIGSRAAGALAFRVLPGAVKDVTDPMSGFFAFRRSAIDVDRLEPLGYKILLEILGTHPRLVVVEVPFAFGSRAAGQSKAGVVEGLRYLRHVAGLRRRASQLPDRPDRQANLGGDAPSAPPSQDQLRILVNANRDTAHEYAGGSEVFMDHVLQGLHKRGHKVHLSVGGPRGVHPYPATEAGGTFSQYLRSPLALALKRKRFDLVVDVANGMSFYSPLVWRGPTICLVHHVHTKMWAEWFSPPVAAFGRFLERRMMPLAYRQATFVAVSDSTKLELEKLGVDPERIEVVHNATLVPEEPAATTDDQPLFVSVGRLVPHKQFHLLLERWPEVRAATNGQLVIIGEGPERERLEPLMSDGVSLRGKVSNEERDQLLARATALVHPSYVEGWGLVVMEAAAQGTPAIGFDVPGMRDSIVDEETGWLAEDMDHFVQRWIETVENPERLLLAAKQAHERAHDFGVAATVDAFEAAAHAAVSAHYGSHQTLSERARTWPGRMAWWQATRKT